jgi:hypothetical protein
MWINPEELQSFWTNSKPPDGRAGAPGKPAGNPLGLKRYSRHGSTVWHGPVGARSASAQRQPRLTRQFRSCHHSRRPPARKTIELEGRLVKDGIRKAISDQKTALADLVHAVRLYRKLVDQKPLTFQGSDCAHAVLELKRRSIGRKLCCGDCRCVACCSPKERRYACRR